MTDKEISNLLGPTFKVNVFESKNAAFRLLKDNINERVPEPSAQNHWKAAWRRFENTSNQYLPKQEAIRIDDKNPELSRLKYTTNYRRQAVIRFLPYVEEKLPLVRGRAKKDLLNSRMVLRYQKDQFPDLRNVTPLKRIEFQTAQPPPPIIVNGPTQENDGCKSINDSQKRIPRDTQGEGHSDDDESDSDFNEWEQDELLEAWKNEEENDSDI